MELPPAPIVVTGATGGLGRHAVQALLRQGWPVRATGRRTEIGRQLSEDGAAFAALDLATADEQALDSLLEGAHAVWHLAARSAPWGDRTDFWTDNLHATERLLASAVRCRVPRFIHVSTPAIYFDFQHHLNIEESFRARRFVNAYAASKAAAEDAVRQFSRRHGLRSVILRPRAIFGPHDQVLLPRLMQVYRRRDGRLPLPRQGEAILDMTYVGNVVHALQLATAADALPSGRAYNITNHAPRPLREVLQQLFVNHLGWPLHIVHAPYPLLASLAQAAQALSQVTGREPRLTAYSVGALNYDMTLSQEAACRELGYVPPISLDDALATTAAWLRHAGGTTWPA